MTRGRCGSLLLHRDGLAPSTPCRSPGALRYYPNNDQNIAARRMTRGATSGIGTDSDSGRFEFGSVRPAIFGPVSRDFRLVLIRNLPRGPLLTDILALDATGQLQALAARRVSALELLEASVARTDRL